MRRYPTPPTAERHPNGPSADLPLRSVPKRPLRPGLVGCAALVAGVLTSTALSAPLAAAAPSSMARSAAALASGTIFVANAGSAGAGKGRRAPSPPTAPGATGNARPIVLITVGINGPQAVAFDPSGDLWVANSNNTVVEYSKAELTKASPSPTVTISWPNPLGPTLDPSGDLWLVNQDPNTGASVTLVEFTKAQLAKSGSPKPGSVSPTSTCATSHLTPRGTCGQAASRATPRLSSSPRPSWPSRALKPHGSPSPRTAWTRHAGPPLTAQATCGWVITAQAPWSSSPKPSLAKSGSQAPRVTLSSDDLSQPGDIAFDASGDLWVPNAGTSTLSEFTKAQLSQVGLPGPGEHDRRPRHRVQRFLVRRLPAIGARRTILVTFFGRPGHIQEFAGAGTQVRSF